MFNFSYYLPFLTINCFQFQTRLLTLRILSQFEAELPPQTEVSLSVPILSNYTKYMSYRNTKLMYFVCSSAQGEENVEMQPVFAVCLQAELVPASVQDYREKLLHLRKLRHDLVQRSLPKGTPNSFQQVHQEEYSWLFFAEEF